LRRIVAQARRPGITGKGERCRQVRGSIFADSGFALALGANLPGQAGKRLLRGAVAITFAAFDRSDFGSNIQRNLRQGQAVLGSLLCCSGIGFLSMMLAVGGTIGRAGLGAGRLTRCATRCSAGALLLGA
jgi:hypothetical protein